MPAVASLLGPVQVVAGGGEIHLGGKLTRRFLARLLLANGKMVSSGELVDAIWSEPKSNDTLRVQVNRLRRLLEPAGMVITTSANSWSLDRTSYRDVRDELTAVQDQLKIPLDPAHAADLCTHALSLWRGPSLADVADETWAEGDAAKLDQIRDMLRQQRAEALACSGQLSAALAEFAWIVRERPFDERGAVWMSACLADLHRNSDALNCLATLRTRLAEQIGFEPGELAARVEHLILVNSPNVIGHLPLLGPFLRTSGPVALSAVPTPKVPTLPGRLVGRGKAWAQLTDSGDNQSFRAVLITGDQGAGKTSLTDEYLRMRVQDGTIVLRGAFRENLDVPHAAVVEALSTSSDPRVAAAVEQSPTLMALRSATLSQADSSEMRPEPIGLALGIFLQTLARQVPVVLVVEDAHWAPTSALVALGRVVNSGHAVTGRPCEVVITCRSEGAYQPRVHDLLTRMSGSRCVVVDLPALGPAEIADLLGGTGRSVEPDLVAAVHALTDGNAFLVNEVVAHFTDEELRSALVRPIGSQQAPTGLPVPIDAVLNSRIRDLSDVARTVLEVVACHRAPLEIDVLSAVMSERDDRELYGAIDEALRAGLLTEDPGDGSLRLRHVLYELAVLAVMAPRARHLLHRRTADVLIGRFNSKIPTAPALVAEHLVGSGPRSEASEVAIWLVKAAEHARAHGAFDSATQTADRAIEILERTVGGGTLLVKALGVRQLVAANSGNAADAKSIGRRIVQVAIEAGDLDAAAQAVVTHSSYGRDQREDPESLALADIVIERSTVGSIARVRALAAKGFHSAFWLGDSVQGRQLAMGAAALARESKDPMAIGEALFALANSQLGRPSMDELTSVVDELRRNGLASGRRTDIVRSWRLSGIAAIQCGDRVALDWSITELERLGVQPGEWAVLADVARWRSSVAHCEGRFDEAELQRLEQRERGFGGAAFEGSAVAQGALQQFAVGRLTAEHPMFPMIRSNRTAWISSVAIHESLLVHRRTEADLQNRLSELLDALGPLERNRNRSFDLASLVIFAEAVADRGFDVSHHARILKEWFLPYSGTFAFSSYGEHIFGSVDRFIGVTCSLLNDSSGSDRFFGQAERQELRLGYLRCVAETASARLRSLLRHGRAKFSDRQDVHAAWSVLGCDEPNASVLPGAEPLTG